MCRGLFSSWQPRRVYNNPNRKRWQAKKRTYIVNQWSFSNQMFVNSSHKLKFHPNVVGIVSLISPIDDRHNGIGLKRCKLPMIFSYSDKYIHNFFGKCHTFEYIAGNIALFQTHHVWNCYKGYQYVKTMWVLDETHQVNFGKNSSVEFWMKIPGALGPLCLFFSPHI